MGATELGPFYPGAVLEAGPSSAPWTDSGEVVGAPDAVYGGVTVDGVTFTESRALKWGTPSELDGGIDVSGAVAAAGFTVNDLVGIKLQGLGVTRTGAGGDATLRMVFATEPTGVGNINNQGGDVRYIAVPEGGPNTIESGGENDRWGYALTNINLSKVGSNMFFRNLSGGSYGFTMDTMALYLYFEKAGALPNRTSRYSRFVRTIRGVGNG